MGVNAQIDRDDKLVDVEHGHLEKYKFSWEWLRDFSGFRLFRFAIWQLIEVPTWFCLQTLDSLIALAFEDKTLSSELVAHRVTDYFISG